MAVSAACPIPPKYDSATPPPHESYVLLSSSHHQLRHSGIENYFETQGVSLTEKKKKKKEGGKHKRWIWGGSRTVT